MYHRFVNKLASNDKLHTNNSNQTLSLDFYYFVDIYVIGAPWFIDIYILKFGSFFLVNFVLDPSIRLVAAYVPKCH